MTTTDARTIPPMPAVDCLSWCEQDHPAGWRRYVRMVDPRIDWTPSPAEVAEHLAAWDPPHSRELAAIDLLDGHVELSVNQWQDDAGREYAALHLTGDAASMTAEQARKLAAALLEGADLLDGIEAADSTVCGERQPVRDDRGQPADLGGYRPRNP